MFCELAQVELKVENCPIAQCMYRAPNGGCAYARLTADDVDVHAISSVTGRKVYKLKSQGAAAKELIEIGLAIDSYAEYVKETVPPDFEIKVQGQSNGVQVVNTKESSGGIYNRLKNIFGLTDSQQHEFWSEERFSKWSKRSEVQYGLVAMRQALVSI